MHGLSWSWDPATHPETCQDLGLEMLVVVSAPWSGSAKGGLSPGVTPSGVLPGLVISVGCRSRPSEGGDVLPAFPQEPGTAGSSNPSLLPHPCVSLLTCSASPRTSSSKGEHLGWSNSPSSFSRYPEKEILRFSGISPALGARCWAEQSQLPSRAARRQPSPLSGSQQLPELTARQRRAWEPPTPTFSLIFPQ